MIIQEFEFGLPLFRYCTVADPDLQMTWGGGGVFIQALRR